MHPDGVIDPGSDRLLFPIRRRARDIADIFLDTLHAPCCRLPDHRHSWVDRLG
jgi:hypothetical protein